MISHFSGTHYHYASGSLVFAFGAMLIHLHTQQIHSEAKAPKPHSHSCQRAGEKEGVLGEGVLGEGVLGVGAVHGV